MQKRRKVSVIYNIFETHDRIAELRKIRSIADWMEYMDLSFAQTAQMIPEVHASTPHSVSRSLVFAWKAGTRQVHPLQIRAMANVTAKWLTEELRQDLHRLESREFRVEIIVGTYRWHVKAWTTCSNPRCHRLYQITREGSRRCKRCIAKSKRRR